MRSRRDGYCAVNRWFSACSSLSVNCRRGAQCRAFRPPGHTEQGLDTRVMKTERSGHYVCHGHVTVRLHATRALCGRSQHWSGISGSAGGRDEPPRRQEVGLPVARGGSRRADSGCPAIVPQLPAPAATIEETRKYAAGRASGPDPHIIRRRARGGRGSEQRADGRRSVHPPHRWPEGARLPTPESACVCSISPSEQCGWGSRRSPWRLSRWGRNVYARRTYDGILVSHKRRTHNGKYLPRIHVYGHAHGAISAPRRCMIVRFRPPHPGPTTPAHQLGAQVPAVFRLFVRRTRQEGDPALQRESSVESPAVDGDATADSRWSSSDGRRRLPSGRRRNS
ncbi:hypothetical protein H180DRAFT_04356 [Streptomyces sp. WMMB 322]|nr:hypothetical protein H180DRAFT_04356 [Streptomyces sp. WMMB 322]